MTTSQLLYLAGHHLPYKHKKLAVAPFSREDTIRSGYQLSSFICILAGDR